MSRLNVCVLVESLRHQELIHRLIREELKGRKTDLPFEVKPDDEARYMIINPRSTLLGHRFDKIIHVYSSQRSFIKYPRGFFDELQDRVAPNGDRSITSFFYEG